MDIDFATAAISRPPFHAVAGTTGRGTYLSYAIAGLEPAVREAHRLVLMMSPSWRTALRPDLARWAIDHDLQISAEGPLAIVIAFHDPTAQGDSPGKPSGWAVGYARGATTLAGIGHTAARGDYVASRPDAFLATGSGGEDPTPPRQTAVYRQPAPELPRLRRVAWCRGHIDAIFAGVGVAHVHTTWISRALGGDGGAHSHLMTGGQPWADGAHAAVSL